MSTLAYVQLTNKRDSAKPGSSTSKAPPGLRTYVDALAALVPAEVLTLHALILAATTKVDGATTTITALPTLKASFWGLLIFAVVLYVVPRILAKKWDKLDWIRAAIPPLAFVGWTMLQRTTAFDAAFDGVQAAPRTAMGLFLGAILGFVAAILAGKADQKPPRNPQPIAT